MPAVPLLIISGPVGVGKTTVGAEVSTILARRRIPHTYIDLDALAATFPRPPGDRFGDRLALANLRKIWPNCAAAGSRNLVIARVVESAGALAAIQGCIPGAVARVCRLTATEATLAARVHARELGSERARHAARARELARSLATAPTDLTVATDGRGVQAIAAEVAGAVQWSPAASKENP